MRKKEIFNKIIKDIKKVKIQGAKNIAKKALYAYFLIPTKKSKKVLISTRPTEPMMKRVLEMAEKKEGSYQKILKHFDLAQKKINDYVFKIIKNNEIIFTHCHSTNVVQSLIYAKRKGKKFEIYNTETRPLFQGRKTAVELKKAGIKVTMFVDSASALAIEKENNKDKIYSDKIFIGADALLPNGIINKIGSNMIAELAKIHKIPFYIVADSLKYTKEKIPIENRKLNEIWNSAPAKIKIKNPAFEFVPKKYITAIVSEHGILKYENFVKKMMKE